MKLIFQEENSTKSLDLNLHCLPIWTNNDWLEPWSLAPITSTGKNWKTKSLNYHLVINWIFVPRVLHGLSHLVPSLGCSGQTNSQLIKKPTRNATIVSLLKLKPPCLPLFKNKINSICPLNLIFLTFHSAIINNKINLFSTFRHLQWVSKKSIIGNRLQHHNHFQFNNYPKTAHMLSKTSHDQWGKHANRASGELTNQKSESFSV